MYRVYGFTDLQSNPHAEHAEIDHQGIMKASVGLFKVETIVKIQRAYFD